MSAAKLSDDCFAHAGDLLRHEEAIALLRRRISPVATPELVSLAAACGRIVRGSVVAPHPVPLHTNAAVDGYALRHADYNPDIARLWPVAGRSAAGHSFTGLHAANTVVRILTGAVMPAGTDTVIMQEDVEVLGGDTAQVLIHRGLKAGANVRKAGEDVAEGSTLFETGHKLRPQDLAALASIGVANVACFSRLKIAIVSTGDEVRPAGSGELRLGDVFDANAPMLHALATQSGAVVSDLGILPDDPAVVRDTLAWAAGDFDVILTSGGASRGDEDHMAAALAALGSRHFWQIAVKPGRPMMFGQIGDTLVVGLPGNPVAVFVCFLMYVSPMVRALSGGAWPEPRRYRLPAAFDFANRKPGRREFWRGMLVETADGLHVDKFQRDGSGLISGLRAADGLIDIPEDVPGIARGDLVDFIPFSEFGV
jgi:molybdopterin molybdotransferase